MTDASGAYTRRKVLAIAAWSAPVIVLATAAPAAASSTSPEVSGLKVEYATTAEGVYFYAQITNTTGAAVNGTVTFSVAPSGGAINGPRAIPFLVQDGQYDVSFPSAGSFDGPRFTGPRGDYTVSAQIGSRVSAVPFRVERSLDDRSTNEL